MTTDLAAGTGGPGGASEDRPPRSARVLVGVLLALLLVPGIVGFDAWPLTGWRLFSVSRGPEQTRWVLRATDGAGDTRTVSLEELPLGYRHAEWPMAGLPGASAAERRDVCAALLGAVVDARPGTVELAVARDRARLVERADGWATEHAYEAVATCRSPPEAGGGR